MRTEPFALPVGTVTFLSADLDSPSSRLSEASVVPSRTKPGAAWRVGHRDGSRHGGVRPVEQREEGSFAAAFARASEAVACSIEVQPRAAGTGVALFADGGGYRRGATA